MHIAAFNHNKVDDITNHLTFFFLTRRDISILVLKKRSLFAEMAEAVEALPREEEVSRAGPSSAAVAAAAELLAEPRAKPRDPPIVFKDVDVSPYTLLFRPVAQVTDRYLIDNLIQKLT